ncbi:MAG: CotH kinase family protein, partial [Gemmataceae bacterium]
MTLALACAATALFAMQPPGGGFPGGPGGPMPQERKLITKYDNDGNGRLDTAERKTARMDLAKEPARGRGPGGKMGRPGGPGEATQIIPKPGLTIQPAEVPATPASEGLYEPKVLRTLFLQFEIADWEAELDTFHKSDVDVPATLIVDGVTHPNVGVHFRGMSSYTHVRPGLKRSLNLTMDFVDPKQRLHGVKTLNLLNAHEDGTFLSSVLYSHIARQYLPAPRANLVRVVINGENWGIYANLEQFNKEFLHENFKTTKGARWKVGGSPMAAAGLEYLGESVEDYKKKYTIKSKDDENAWKALVQLCKVLKETPTEKLEEALSPILDIDNALWFLALDNALINCDGYWIRASDYSLYQDIRGKFHLIPHDMNEAFRTPQGPGMGGPGGRGPR